MLVAARGGETAVLHSELPGLVNILLKMNPEEIAQTINNPPAAAKQDDWNASLFNNSVMAWFVEHCAPCRGHAVSVGKKVERTGYARRTLENTDTELFPSYLQYAEEENIKGLGKNRFTETLLDVAQQLKCPVEKKRQGGSGHCVIIGIKLLAVNDDRYDWFDHQS